MTSAHLLCSRHSFNIYIFIHHNNDVTQKKVPVSSFGHVSSAHGRDASAHQILRNSNSELLTFSEIQDGGLHHLGFSSHVNLKYSVMSIVRWLSSIMLKLKTQLDIVKYSLWVKKFSARGRPGGVGPPSVNLGPL